MEEKDFKVINIDIGNRVVCDVCNEEYTDRDDQGGFIFGSYAYCPTCAERTLPKIKGYNEEYMIKAKCPPGKSFKDFVLGYR